MSTKHQVRCNRFASLICSTPIILAGIIISGMTIPSRAALAKEELKAEAPFPHGPVRWSDGSGEAELHVAGDAAALTLRLPDGDVALLRQIDDPNDALAVLADERLRFTWPALLSWAGGDLALLRDRSLVQARTGFEIGLPRAIAKGQAEKWSGTWQQAKLQYARALSQTGHRTEAAAMLRREIGNLPPTEKAAYDRVFSTIRLAGIVFDTDAASAIGLLERLIADPATSEDMKINLEVNLAQYLARSGGYTRALPLIDKVWATFSQSDLKDQKSEKLPDSEAQFAWIKACALHGLGREADADQLMSLISGVSVTTSEIPIPNHARLRGFMCMKDANALAKEFANQLRYAPPGADLFRELQPESQEYAPDHDIVAAALRVPELAQAVTTKVHFLSGSLTPALREWRDGKSVQ